jgi:type IV secretory pathway TrbD component
MTDDVSGWHAPVYHSLAQPILFAGVPHNFLVLLLTSTVIVTLRWWPAMLVGALLYGVARIGSTVEPQWLGILLRHIGYGAFYEG